MKQTVILLCGLPYSGKSSFAQALAADGFEVISLDAINQERGFGIDGAPVPGSEWLETHQIAHSRMRALLADDKPVVWDDTNYAAWIRDPIFEAAIEAGGDPVVVFVDTPIEEIRNRRATATAAGLPPLCPNEDFERAVQDFERPCCGIRVEGTLPVSQAIGPVRRAIRQGQLT